MLLLVDIIWVSSSELTKYIYHHASFEKPFFSTYVKTSMFTIYLLGLCIWPSWRENCNKPSNYMYLETEVDADNFSSEVISPTLSSPTFIPVKWPERTDKGSGTESDDTSINRAVRFSKLAEVRQMSDSDANEALWARLSYQATIRAGHLAKRAANRLSIDHVAKIALMFCFLWFLANYTFQAALVYTEPSTVAVLSSSSSLFTLLLASLFPSNPSDKFTLSKLVAVICSITGLVMVGVSESSLELKLPLGAVLSLISAFCYASYLVFLRRMVDNEEKMEIPIFFGFVGLFNLILLWPTFFLLHYSNWELFEWPNKHQWLFLIINGLVGTVLSEVLWLWGCLLTSSLIATVALSLTIPLSMLADMVLSTVAYSSLFYIGSIPVFVSFFFITILAHYENIDPLCDIVRKIFGDAQSKRLREYEIEQRESLISINEEDHEA